MWHGSLHLIYTVPTVRATSSSAWGTSSHMDEYVITWTNSHGRAHESHSKSHHRPCDRYVRCGPGPGTARPDGTLLWRLSHFRFSNRCRRCHRIHRRVLMSYVSWHLPFPMCLGICPFPLATSSRSCPTSRHVPLKPISIKVQSAPRTAR